MISALEEQKISSDDFNLAIDALKGNKSAIKKLMDILTIKVILMIM